MKDYLKYITVIIVCVTTSILTAQIRSCSNVPGAEEVSTVTPRDTSFVPVLKTDYRPRSMPFEKEAAKPAHLPNDATEREIARIVSVVKRIPSDSAGKFIKDSTNIVITKFGGVFVEKQIGIETNVKVVEFLPPILQWNIYFSAGVNYSSAFAPSAAVAPLLIYDKVQFPILMVDPMSVGIGIGYRYRDFLVGISTNKRFADQQNSLKLFAHYSF